MHFAPMVAVVCAEFLNKVFPLGNVGSMLIGLKGSDMRTTWLQILQSVTNTLRDMVNAGLFSTAKLLREIGTWQRPTWPISRLPQVDMIVCTVSQASIELEEVASTMLKWLCTTTMPFYQNTSYSTKKTV